MIISLIVAVSENRGIGRDGRIPWRLRDEQQFFKRVTMGHTLIMGRKTYKSIGRPLPGRQTIVLTRDPEYIAEGCQVCHALAAALTRAKSQGETEVFIAGGSTLYAESLPQADRLYLTTVHVAVPADTFFPPLDKTEWVAIKTQAHPADERNEHAFTIKVLERVKREA